MYRTDYRLSAPSPSRGAHRQSLLALVACISLAGCGQGTESEPPPAAIATVTAGVYSEIHDFAQVQANLHMLQAHGLGLYQVISPNDVGTAPLGSLIDACAAAGIEFRAWLVLPETQGYWPNEANVELFAQAVTEFLAWLQNEQLTVGWITFDMEPGWDYSEQLMAIASDDSNPNKNDDLIDLIRSHHDPTSYATSVQQFQAIVQLVHDAGLKAHAVTYPSVLDDLADGDTDIQDGFDTPIEGIEWDEVSFMTYRSVLETFGGTAVDTDIFYGYGRDARLAFGSRAGLDFGLVGTGYVAVQGSYRLPQTLQADVAAARAAGIDRLHLYSFEGSRAQIDPSQWLDFAAATPAPAPVDDPAPAAVRTVFQLLDGVLDGEH